MIRINSQPIQSSLPDKTPLLNLLRDELGLAGAKLGCGEGECGACMVLVDGRPQTSCNLPLWAVEDHDITTLEGLGLPSDLMHCKRPLWQKTPVNAGTA